MKKKKAHEQTNNKLTLTSFLCCAITPFRVGKVLTQVRCYPKVTGRFANVTFANVKSFRPRNNLIIIRRITFFGVDVFSLTVLIS